MDVSGVFTKLRNTLSSTVNEISAVLPGNPLLREYDAGDQVGSAGPRYLWKIYQATKKSTKADVALWIFEKKQLDQFNRTDREMIVEVLRKGCVQMTKLRHPRVLIVEHLLEESRESLAFCTEPVFASLGNVLGRKNNIDKIPKELQPHELHEVEIKYGLMQIAEALAFLHSSVRMVHGNLCPESIIINKMGAWKIAGFDFCIPNSGTVSETKFVSSDWDTSIPSPALPNPNYLAPEYILSKSCSPASDLFSLGILLYSIYYKGKTLFECGTQDVYRVMPKSVDQLENLSPHQLEKIPQEVREHEKMLLNPSPNVRPDAEQMSKLPFFEHVGVKTLQYLDTLLQQENLQKSQFFKGLPKVLPQLPRRVLMQRVLPCLTTEFTNHDMVPFVLPNVLLIAEDTSKEEFLKEIFPKLIPVFKIQRPIQVLLILLKKMDLLLSKSTPSLVNVHILPMLCASLEAPSVQIQELCLTIIPSFAEQIELPAMKNSILPKIKKIAHEGSVTAIRIKALVCLGKLLPVFDKWYVQDEILPFLQKISSREPGILMAILGIYKTALTSDKLGISKDIMALKGLPHLIPLSVDNNLNLQQYLAFMSVIKDMLQRIEKEHKTKLEQLSRMRLEQDAALDFTRDQTNGVSTTEDSVDDMFKSEAPPKNPESSSTSRQHLTLEEKQRLARMKEQENRMKKTGDIKPVNVGKPMINHTHAKPKDLTSSLMQSNVQAMGASRSKPMSSMMSQPMSMMSQPVSSMMSQPTPMMSQPMPMMSQPKPMMSQPKPMMSQPTPMMSQQKSQSSNFGMSSASQSSMLSPAPSTAWQSKTNSLSNNSFGMQKSTTYPSYNNGHNSINQNMGAMNMNTPNPFLNPTPSSNSGFNGMGNPYMQSSNSNPSSMQNQYGMKQSNSNTTANLSKQDLLDFLG
ncbi:SCY1-like protein 2 [Ciona intestinalis]